jgi:hypothetical protein
MSMFADPLLSRSFIYKMLKMSGMKVPFVVCNTNSININLVIYQSECLEVTVYASNHLA